MLLIILGLNISEPVGYYTLTLTATANDSSPSGNPPGIIASAFPAPGVYGKPRGSYSFSGKRSPPSYIRLPKSNALDAR